MLDLNAVYFLKHLFHEFVIRDNFRFERKNSIDFVEKKNTLEIQQNVLINCSFLESFMIELCVKNHFGL